MDPINTLYRAQLLLEQQRFHEAKDETKQVLSSDPTNTEALQTLTQCYLGLNQTEKAHQTIEDAIRQDPTDFISLYLKGVILHDLAQYRQSLKFIDSAISFNPTFAEAYGIKSAALYALARFEEALEAANQGLSLEADNTFCLNQRARALLKLGRTAENEETIQQALKSNPEDADTHSNVGYTQLELGNYAEAKNHFREALRLDPTHEYARYGMLQTLKATNLFYRGWLKYVFWMQGLSPRTRWAVIIIGYLLFRWMSSARTSFGSLEVVALVLIYGYFIFAISTWIIEPVSNVFLRFHSFGQYVLTDEEKKTANYAGVLLGAALLGLLILLAAEQVQWYNLGMYLLCYGIALTVAISAVASKATEKGTRNVRSAALILATVAVINILLGVIDPKLAVGLFSYAIWGFIGFQFFANSQH